MTAPFETPIVLFVFNRIEQTARVFEAIRAARPEILLVAADGPRRDREGEAETCARVRAVATAVDWPCTIHTNFLDENTGCDRRVVSGLDWAFGIVEEAIILEDDCIPDQSFFPFCAELLSRYRDAQTVTMVSGFNGVPGQVQDDCSYYFGMTGSCWGWATWRSRWQSFDADMKLWPEWRAAGRLDTVFRRKWDRRYYTARFDECYSTGEQSPWDYRWFFTRIVQGGLAAVPRMNLVENIGFGAGATHTLSEEPYPLPVRASLSFPLVHPAAVAVNAKMDILALDRLRHPLPKHIWIKVKNILRSLSK